MKFRVFWDVLPCSQLMLTDVSEVRTASIISLMMQAVRTSETSVNIYLTTQQFIPEDSTFHSLLLFTKFVKNEKRLLK
jgi:hypothetical protein